MGPRLAEDHTVDKTTIILLSNVNTSVSATNGGHHIQSYFWSDLELQYQNSKFGIWFCIQPMIYLISQYDFYDVLALYRAGLFLIFAHPEVNYTLTT